MQKEAFEPTGLIPRSIIRTFDRFLQQLLPGSENIAIQEYRISRYQILVSMQSLFVLICLPLCVNSIVKSFLFIPLTEHFWNSQQTEIFLNAYQEKRAFAEMQDFSEKIFFESLLRKQHTNSQMDSAHLDPLTKLQVKNNVRNICHPLNALQKISIIRPTLYTKKDTDVQPLPQACTSQKITPGGKGVGVTSPHTRSWNTHALKQKQKDVSIAISRLSERGMRKEQYSFFKKHVLAECSDDREDLSVVSQPLFSFPLSSFHYPPSSSSFVCSDQEFSRTQKGAFPLGVAVDTSFKQSSPPLLIASSFDERGKGMEKQTIQEEYTLQEMFQRKSLQIATRYNQQSILAITNVCADLVTFGTLYLLSLFMRAQIIILKSFVIESIYSLSDTTKSFLLILGMDLLVGFHSPRGWEIALETCIRHFGLPENENFILLFVAFFPVFLDTVFKYWIFRYLNKISPSTVVTYHSMLE